MVPCSRFVTETVQAASSAYTVPWFNPSQQLSPSQLFAHSPPLGQGRVSEGKSDKKTASTHSAKAFPHTAPPASRLGAHKKLGGDTARTAATCVVLTHNACT